MKNNTRVHDPQFANSQQRVLVVRLADERSIRVTQNRIPLLRRPNQHELHFVTCRKPLSKYLFHLTDGGMGRKHAHGLARREPSISANMKFRRDEITRQKCKIALL